MGKTKTVKIKITEVRKGKPVLDLNQGFYAPTPHKEVEEKELVIRKILIDYKLSTEGESMGLDEAVKQILALISKAKEEERKRITKTKIKNLLWKFSYGEWNNGNLPEDVYEKYETYPDFLTDKLLEALKGGGEK